MNTPIENFLAAIKAHDPKPTRTARGWKCRCPAHDDSNPSLSVMQTEDGTVLVHCFAGCETAEVCRKLGLRLRDLFPKNASRATRGGKASKQAAPADHAAKAGKARVFPSLADAKRELERWLKRPAQNYWVYHAASGEVARLIFRFPVGPAPVEPGQKPGKTFRPISRVTGGWVIADPDGPLPLYRLPQLLALKPGSRVYVVEGEKTADAAVSLGLEATTSCHGSDGWAKSDWSVLRGLDIVVLPDRDDAGEKYADNVAQAALKGGAASVRIVKLWDAFPDIPDGGDLADLIGPPSGGPGDSGDSGDCSHYQHLVSKIEQLVQQAPLQVLSEPARAPDASGSDPSSTCSERLVALALEQFAFFRSSGVVYAAPKNGPNLVTSLDGDGFRDLLASQYRRRFGGIASGHAMTDAISTLRGEAYDGVSEEVYLRVARCKESVFLDLGRADGCAVEVTESGWCLCKRAPVKFCRSTMTGELAIPVLGGSIDELRAVLNVTDDSWPLVVGWIVAALIADIAHPILFVGGLHGTGKSTVARFIGGVVDPSPVLLRGLPRDEAALMVSAGNSWISIFDNVSNIPSWLSDALCRVVTGDAYVSRKLYSNSEPSVVSYRRPIGITSIDVGTLRGDLGDRMLLVDPAPLSGRNRRSERELLGAYESIKPRVLGAFLTLLARVLGKLPAIQITDLPRMADFGMVLGAIDECTGLGSLDRFRAQAQRVAIDVVESEPLAAAIVELMKTQAVWQGSATELRSVLSKLCPDYDLPSTGKAIGSALRRAAPSLRELGIYVVLPRLSDKTRTFILRSIARIAQPPELNAPEHLGANGNDRVVGRLAGDRASGTSPDRPNTAPGGEVAS